MLSRLDRSAARSTDCHLLLQNQRLYEANLEASHHEEMAAVQEKLATAVAEAAEHQAQASRLARDNSCLSMERVALQECASAVRNDAETKLSQLRTDSSNHMEHFKETQMKLVKTQRDLAESKQSLKASEQVSPS